MTVLAPIWLLLLAPWAVLAWWVLTRRSESATVPFVELWRTNDPSPARRATRRIRRPPLPISLLLIAALVGVLAAARPGLRSRVGPPLTIVLDRGVTMSSRAIDVDSAVAEISRAYASREVRTVAVPAATEAGVHQPTALDTSSLLPETIRLLVKATANGPIAVISNQRIAMDDPRIVQVMPPTTRPTRNVGFVRVGARRSPRPSVMARVRNRSDAKRTDLRVTSDGQTTTRTIDLPADGQEQDYFVDLDRMGATLAFELLSEGPDDYAVDDRAWLAQPRAWPKLEPVSALPPALSRVIELYAKHRPPAEVSAIVKVVTDARQVPPDRASVALELARASPGAKGDVHVAAHPVTSEVTGWDAIVSDAQIASVTGEGWTPVVSVATVTLVAVREAPARQVRVGFWSESFARSPAFVIFWTNVFDWLGGGKLADEFISERVRQLGEGWSRDEHLSGPAATAEPSAGVYVEAGGRAVAMNAIDLPMPMESEPLRLPKSAATEETGSAVELSRWLAVAAALAVASAVASLGVRRRTEGDLAS